MNSKKRSDSKNSLEANREVRRKKLKFFLCVFVVQQNSSVIKNVYSSPKSTECIVKENVNFIFFRSCENGDYRTVIKILKVIPDFNVNVTDNLGRTALRLAVENEHLEVNQSETKPNQTQHILIH